MSDDDLEAAVAMPAAHQTPGDQRAVVGPDCTGVVAERIERRIVGRHRPDAPARPQGRLEHPLADLLDTGVRNDAAPQQVAHVRAAGIHRAFVAVEPKRAEGKKCARSWKISPLVGTDREYPDVTPRDAQALREFHAARRAAE